MLQELKVPPQAKQALIEMGLDSVEKIADYAAAGGVLAEIAGVGPASAQKIVAHLKRTPEAANLTASPATDATPKTTAVGAAPPAPSPESSALPSDAPTADMPSPSATAAPAANDSTDQAPTLTAGDAASVAVELPLGEISESGFLGGPKIQVHLTLAQRRTLRRIFNALHAQDAKLADGRHVDRLPNAIQWILDQAALSAVG